MDLDVLGTNNTFQKQVCYLAMPLMQACDSSTAPPGHSMALTVDCYPEHERMHAFVLV